jgi:hypothetical protein
VRWPARGAFGRPGRGDRGRLLRHGRRRGAPQRDGSFYDFTAELFHGTSRETLATPPDEWGGRAGVDWARRLAAGERFDAASERLVEVAAVLDRIYGR